MNRPEIGKMNRRIKIFHTMSVPDERLGFSKASVREDVVWGRLEPVGSCIYFGSKQIESGVTHRVIVRSMPGRTGRRDFKGVTELMIEGVIYRLRRVADLGGLDRFTVLDVEEKTDACSMPRRSWLQGN